MSIFAQLKKECPTTAPWVIQGSIYKVIHKSIIHSDYLNIVCWFTDWKDSGTLSDPSYPKSPITTYKFLLASEEATIHAMRAFISELEKHEHTPEPDLPDCTNDELWRDPPTYKYYKNPMNKTRSTKNFDDFAEARKYFAEQGFVGELVTVEGKAMCCNYCDAAPVCSQYRRLKEAGMIKE